VHGRTLLGRCVDIAAGASNLVEVRWSVNLFDKVFCGLHPLIELIFRGVIAETIVLIVDTVEVT
jgi:hypothetical protein